MIENYIHIPTYKIDVPPSIGSYCGDDVLAKYMQEILQKLDTINPTTFDIPNIPGAILTGQRVGRGILLSARLDLGNDSDHLGDIPHIDSHLALDEESARAACRAARDNAIPYGFETNQINPDWARAMIDVPAAPFTVVIPNRKAMEVIGASAETCRQLTMLTGFFQTLIGQVLQDECIVGELDGGLQPNDFDTNPMIWSTDPQALACAVQRDGEMPNQLIVRPGEEGLPDIYAHVIDIELDVFTVKFIFDGTMTVDTNNLSYLMLDAETLMAIQELHAEANKVWKYVFEIYDEDEFANRKKGDPDPLQDIYTTNDKFHVPDSLADDLRTRMGF